MLGHHLHAAPGELIGGASRKLRHVAAQHPVAGIDQDDPGLARINGAEIAAERFAGDLAERSRQLHAGRAAADNDEGEQRRPLFRVSFPFGGFEGEKDLAAHLQRIVDIFQPRREWRPLVMSEVGMTGPGGENQIVERYDAIREDHLLVGEIDAGHFGQLGGRVRLLAEDRADRVGDISRRKRRRRHLVQQRLKEMIVLAIDDGDLHRRITERFGGVKPAESTADNHDAWE